jgi:hypothetical protein
MLMSPQCSRQPDFAIGALLLLLSGNLEKNKNVSMEERFLCFFEY